MHFVSELLSCSTPPHPLTLHSQLWCILYIFGSPFSISNCHSYNFVYAFFSNSFPFVTCLWHALYHTTIFTYFDKHDLPLSPAHTYIFGMLWDLCSRTKARTLPRESCLIAGTMWDSFPIPQCHGNGEFQKSNQNNSSYYIQHLLGILSGSNQKPFRYFSCCCAIAKLQTVKTLQTCI